MSTEPQEPFGGDVSKTEADFREDSVHGNPNKAKQLSIGRETAVASEKRKLKSDLIWKVEAGTADLTYPVITHKEH